MLWILAFVGASIVGYGVVMTVLHGPTFTKDDVFNRRVFTTTIFGERCCSWWPLSHFVLFFILGLMFPHCFWQAMVAGIAWEFMESTAPAWPMIRTVADADVEYKKWWTPSPKDVLFNLAGFLLALLVR